MIGSGTVSSPDYARTGSCCIAERRAIEMIERGTPVTEFLRFDDRVAMTARLNGDLPPPFGAINQRVVRPQ